MDDALVYPRAKPLVTNVNPRPRKDNDMLLILVALMGLNGGFAVYNLKIGNPGFASFNAGVALFILGVMLALT